MLWSMESSKSGILGASEMVVTLDWVDNREALDCLPFLPRPALGAVVPAKVKNRQSGDRR